MKKGGASIFFLPFGTKEKMVAMEFFLEIYSKFCWKVGFGFGFFEF